MPLNHAELKPCPFCGGEAHYEPPCIACQSCGVRLPLCGESWNRRALPPSDHELPAQPEPKSHPVVDLTCAECGHVDTVYAGSLSAKSCPNCKHPRPAHGLEANSPPAKADGSSRASDSRREALSDAAKATCEKCARGEALEFQADPTPMYWHRAVECAAAPIHALLAKTR